MSRPYRIQAEKAFYHITSRGDGRRAIFKGEKDFKKFLEYLLRAKEKFRFHLYAYLLMTNHYHLLIQTLEPNLSKIMHYINSVYTTYYNKVNRNVGHLFQGRYKSLVIEPDSYFKEMTRYIHLNPVRAKMVEKPEDYEWTSYKGYLNRKGDAYIDKEKLGKVLGMGAKEYRKFIYDGMEKEEDIFKEVYAGSMLGSVKFIKEKLTELKDQIEGKEIAYKKEYDNSIEPDWIINRMIKEYKIEKEEILGSKYKHNKEKKEIIYMLKRMTDLSNKDIGEMFGIGQTGVSKICSRLEEAMKNDKRLKKRIVLQMSLVKG